MGERLIFTDLVANNNKFWHGEVEGTVLKTNWGRVGDNGQFKDYPFSFAGAAQEKLDSIVRSKLRKGYTRQHTMVNGEVTTKAAPTNIKQLATTQIQHGGNKETIELIEFLVARNIHTIEGATTIRYVNGGLQTPLGPVTPEGLDRAEELLSGMIDVRSPDFLRYANEYLRIVPHIVDRKGTNALVLFGTHELLQEEKALIDAMRAVVVDDTTPATASTVFQTKLDLITSDSYDFKRIVKAFASTLNRMHASANLRLRRVWAMEIEASAKAFERELKPVEKLWHGSKDANLLSILKGGYVIPRTGGSIAVTGRMFGDGVYFSDQSTKSLNYATGSAPGQYGYQGSQRKFMLWNDVAMGKKYLAPRPFSGGCRPGYDSTFAQAGKSGVMNNEMIVYRPSQVNPRYLCEFS